MNDGEGLNSRESAWRAGWNGEGGLRAEAESNSGTWKELLAERRGLKWGSFSWLTVRALFESVNDLFAKYRPELVDERRARWLAAQRGRRPVGIEELIVRRGEEIESSFLVMGDTGEQDASQYALAPVLSGAASDGAAAGSAETVEPDFLVIASDVIYPAGDANEYVNGFYVPYRSFEKPIYALPGNHDWYDGLDGFMYHFCGAEPLPPEHFRATEIRPSTRLARVLWRGADLPKRQLLSAWRDSRKWGRDATKAVQPAPYFAIELRDLLLVCIDTGVIGTIDEEQALWLVKTSNRPKRKILLTGKPIYVNGAYHPGDITWQREREEDDPDDPRRFATVDEIVREPGFGYLAAIGGDVHNYQRYPIRLREEDGSTRTIHYLVSGGGGAYLSPTHRIPPLESTPQTEHPWPADRLSLPKDEDAFERIPRAGTAGGDPDVFRCYPRRGDSLAYSARRAGPRIFDAVQAATIAFIAAVTLLLYAAPLHSTGAAALGVAAGTPLIAGLAFLGIRKLLRRGADEGETNGSAPPTPPPERIKSWVAVLAFAAIALLGLGAFTADWLIESELLTSPRFWGMLAVTILVPFLLVGAIVLAHDLRGSTPSFAPELAIAGALTAALAIAWTPGPIGDAPAWFVTIVAVLMLVAILMLAVGAARRRWPTWDGDGGTIYGMVDSALFVAAPLALATSLALNTDADRIPLLGVAIAACGAYPALLKLVPGGGKGPTLDDSARTRARVRAASSLLATAAWITVGALLLNMVGDGWIPAAAIGAVSVLTILLVAAMLIFLFATRPLNGGISICLALAPALIVAKFIGVEAFLLIAILLAISALASVSRLRSGRLNADAAQTEIRARLRGTATPAGAWPRSRELASNERTLFDLLYPYRWKSDLDEGAERTGALSQTVARLVAELSDSDDPPFFKHLLRIDIRTRKAEPGEEDRELTIRCFGVTGYREEETSPPLEDEIAIPFHSREQVAASSAPDGPPSNAMARVLFVCLHNAGRSQMSEALFARAAGSRHEARSAGTTPGDRIHPEVIDAMAELEVDLSDRTPRGLSRADAEWADVVVTMGCGDECPYIPGKRYLDWDLSNPAGRPLEEVRATRDEIERRVQRLLAELD